MLQPARSLLPATLSVSASFAATPSTTHEGGGATGCGKSLRSHAAVDDNVGHKVGHEGGPILFKRLFFLPETAFLKRKLAKIVLPVVFFYRPLHSSVQVPHAPSQKYDGCLCGQGGNVPLLDVRPHQYTQASVLYSLIWRPICFAETALKHLKVIHFHFNTKILNRVLSRCCH